MRHESEAVDGLWTLRAPLLGGARSARRSRRSVACALLMLCAVALVTATLRDAATSPMLLLGLFAARSDDYNACGRATLTVALGDSVIDCGDVITQLVSRQQLHAIEAPRFSLATAGERALYALAVVDLDAPSPDAPTDREYRHWLLGNILGWELKSGNITRMQELSKWEPPHPPSGSGQHRYVFLLFSEYGPAVNFDPVPAERKRWDAQTWANSYGFGPPVASTSFVVDG